MTIPNLNFNTTQNAKSGVSGDSANTLGNVQFGNVTVGGKGNGIPTWAIIAGVGIAAAFLFLKK